MNAPLVIDAATAGNIAVTQQTLTTDDNASESDEEDETMSVMHTDNRANHTAAAAARTFTWQQLISLPLHYTEHAAHIESDVN